MTIHEKAIRLLEGGVVEINSDWFRLKALPNNYPDYPCIDCNLDSICREQHSDVCGECEAISHKRCQLQLAHKVLDE